MAVKGMAVAHCRGCGAEIIWIRTPAGKAMPCNPERVCYWQNPTGYHRIVTPNGVVVSADLDVQRGPATGLGYISHFATCPAADHFRGVTKMVEASAGL